MKVSCSRAPTWCSRGQSLYEAKRDSASKVYAFRPAATRPLRTGGANGQPAAQAGIPHPRLGFFGVIDERLDIELLDRIAEARPDWQLVMIGPVVKIEPATLPRRPNIHYLGAKSYQELPAYLSGWDVALLPFARNESTRFISPTKTPEYLAAGRPVVSTSIRDVVRPYGQQGMVRIADSVAEFIAAVEAALDEEAVPRIREVERSCHSFMGSDLAAHANYRRAITRSGALTGRAPRQRATVPKAGARHWGAPCRGRRFYDGRLIFV